MEAFIQRLERSTLWQAIIYFVLGVLILLYPRFFFDVMVYVIAGYLAIMGIWMIFQGLRRRQGGLPPTFFMGLIYLILAAVVFFFAETLASLLPILIGALFLFGGIIRLIQALGYRQSMSGRWLWFLIGSLLWIGVGILMLTNPFSSLLVLFQLFGGILIAIAIMELFLYFTIRSTKRQARY
ncbi:MULTISPECIES: DUF308 domain-containing protein [unclassified Exiguobacterium]|uniref:HdeD family acid-resistance protein n=1 Tax=unclassified Exiguobacterium TaxID=2644629 RepID=UPI001BEC78C7|nr:MULTISPECIES: DUF308 domain-containing protein [unclassified Exiguobacterium]